VILLLQVILLILVPQLPQVLLLILMFLMPLVQQCITSISGYEKQALPYA